jgi:hypothetical protein
MSVTHLGELSQSHGLSRFEKQPLVYLNIGFLDLNSAIDHIPFELYVKNKHTSTFINNIKHTCSCSKQFCWCDLEHFCFYSP